MARLNAVGEFRSLSMFVFFAVRSACHLGANMSQESGCDTGILARDKVAGSKCIPSTFRKIAEIADGRSNKQKGTRGRFAIPGVHKGEQLD